ncbi:MAG: hypothetical protein E6700_01835 [Winkia neuii]|uniref:Glycosyl hydrolase n=1 Tax=Winkia neuii TaxID=33007 RepID=A0A2I1IM32_9ACTO|nr:hypothetical protein [Winkia neuii]OFJ70875.1 hypothetical protein HMPREF2851_08865 [Actinomyces sp. HMSC064C12]OFK02441.1 hypothetical protein HMPREF2835_06790 [Actinomyces sp. HMSC072A03]OFT53894.1 hypothetical protein HMPREF3152_11025 [Actinomyces sp. HMSC06A08]MDK8099185.1 hypothetical protein [Winkia neuii]MDU3134298.1 hypothetical protein [Winkia neuii]
MKIGVNYVPRVGWFYQWAHLDKAALRDDFQAIAEIGLDHVRLFPLWPLLQPNRALISDSALADVEAMAQVALDAGLQVSVDVLQGHLSSYDFLPSWVLSWHRRNIFTDPQVVSAETELVAKLCERLAPMEGVTGICLGNEIVQFAARRHPHPCQVSSEAASKWVDLLLHSAYEAWPDGQHTFCFDDDVLFDPTQPFDPSDAAKGAAITAHSWIFGRLGPKIGKDHPWLALFARYLLELERAWHPGKPLWLQEVGAPLNYLSKEYAPEFVHQTLCHAASVAELQQITWWCSHDLDPALADFPEVEYDLGIFDYEGNLKPTGKALSEWAKAARQGNAPACKGGSRQLEIDGPDTGRVSTRPDGEIFATWARAIEQGEPLVLRSRQ